MANRTCSVDGCDRKHYAKSYCEACYKRVKATGSTAYREYPKVPCAASECAEVAVAKGLCKRCYQRNRTGTLGLPKRTGAGEPMRWLQQMVAVGNRDSGCWATYCSTRPRVSPGWPWSTGAGRRPVCGRRW